MKTKTYPIFGGIFLVALAFFVGRCSAPKTDAPSPHPPHATSQNEPTVWTCSMHPQIQQPEPGSCPICGMDLIPLENDSSDEGPRTLTMSAASKALAEIQTTAVERRFPTAEIRLVGTLAYDQTKVRSLTARFPARIEKLFVNYTGVPVKKGDHLARVYSPDLLTAQSELLTAYRYDPDSAATQAAREKLRLWDLLPEQIDAIITEGVATDTFELKAPVSGVVVTQNVNEGAYLKTGEPLFKIVDLSELWLELEAYESDLTWLKIGQTVDFSVQSIPGQNFEGRLTFIEPEFDRQTRTVNVRVNVPNPKQTLKPGMFARATVRSRVASDGHVFAPEYAGKWISPMHPEIVKDGPGQCDICGMDLVPAEELGYVQEDDPQPPLVVPATAVLRTGKRSIVYIEIPNTERPTYEGREVEIGPRAGDSFLVVSGLEEGDRVVTNGAFKIDSALQIKAKPSMMNPDHDMEGEAMSDHTHSQEDSETDEITLDLETAQQTLPSYFALQDALASDDLDAAKSQLQAIMEVTGHSGALPDLIHQMLAATELDQMRRPHFETLSEAYIKIVSENPDAFEESVFRMHCPMVYPDRGADWLQSNDTLKNPYFGAMMLTCGEVKGEIGGARGSNRDGAN